MACPSCGHGVEVWARVCPECGADLHGPGHPEHYETEEAVEGAAVYDPSTDLTYRYGHGGNWAEPYDGPIWESVPRRWWPLYERIAVWWALFFVAVLALAVLSAVGRAIFG